MQLFQQWTAIGPTDGVSPKTFLPFFVRKQNVQYERNLKKKQTNWQDDNVVKLLWDGIKRLDMMR